MQRKSFSLNEREDGLIALAGGTIIDGYGGEIIENGTVLIKGNRILDVGAGLTLPGEANTVDLSGKFIIPGLIDMHAHFFGYATATIGSLLDTYLGLFLAGGVTTVRSPGEYAPFEVLVARDEIDAGKRPGCRIVCAGPYFDHKPSAVSWFDCITSAEDAANKFALWKNEIDFVKVYSNIQEDELAVLVRLAHNHELKVAGHLGSITAKRAIELGIDCLEHGVFHMPEFTRHVNKANHYEAIARIYLKGEQMSLLLEQIVAKGVAVVPTTVIFQLFGSFDDVDQDWTRFLTKEAREQQDLIAARFPAPDPKRSRDLDNAVEKQLEFIYLLHNAGGKVFCGTDPTLPRLVPGKALHREMELFVSAGLSPMEVIKIATHDSAAELGMGEHLGSIAQGKIADMVVLDRDPLVSIRNIGSISAIYKDGVRYSPDLLTSSMEGSLGKSK